MFRIRIDWNIETQRISGYWFLSVEEMPDEAKAREMANEMQQEYGLTPIPDNATITTRRVNPPNSFLIN